MLIKKRYQFYITLITLLLFSLCNLISSKPPAEESKFKIKLKPVLIGADYSDLYKEVSNYFIDVLKSKNFTTSYDALEEIAFSILDLSEENKIIISISFNISLPDNIINLAVEHEAFYKDVSDTIKFPPEGRDIRKMVTKEFIYNYRESIGNQIIVTDKTNLKKDCEEFINKVISRIVKNQKRS